MKYNIRGFLNEKNNAQLSQQSNKRNGAPSNRVKVQSQATKPSQPVQQSRKLNVKVDILPKLPAPPIPKRPAPPLPKLLTPQFAQMPTSQIAKLPAPQITKMKTPQTAKPPVPQMGMNEWLDELGKSKMGGKRKEKELN